MTNEKVRSALLMMAQAVTTQTQAMTAQATRGVESNVNPNVSTMSSRLIDFVRMNPPRFLGFKVGEDPQEFLDELYKIVNAMGVTSIEKMELAAYQLKDVAQIWFTQWKANRPVGADSWCMRNLLRSPKELKRGRFDEQGQPRFKKRAPNQDFSSTPKVYQERGSGPPFTKPTCHNCGKKHHGKCLAGISRCYVCGKNDHQVKDCPTLTARGRETKQASLDGPNSNAPKRNRFYVLQANKDKGANPDEGTGK
ncbi:uncharacterized protein LOC125873715 [Solanum stenotomum]|uniref:uncharacterized protein LOC125873715 n=1 Tax=Solanum stenotomum TaxID=172797 RepID=UPI0020D0FF8E|nr:uncharacterized protein LOC125873715 [Solanum stenotomum]